MRWTVRNLDNELMNTEIEGSLRQALYAKVGMKALHPCDAIVIEDADGYVVSGQETARWMATIARVQ